MMKHFEVNALRVALQTRWLGQQVFYQAEVGSTNDELKKLGETTAVSPGALFITDYQNRGRGRFDRRWEAPPGTSLLFSLLLRPDWPGEQNGWLTMMASLAVAEAIQSQTGLAARIKWPNDVVLPVDGNWRKVCGILLEGEMTEDGRCRQAILGVGLNVNIPAAVLPTGTTPATSLWVASGQQVSRLALLLDVLVRLENLLDAAVDGRSPQPAWKHQLMMLGQPVTATYADGGVQMVGTAVGVDEWGHLLLQTADGHQHTILAADVTLRAV
ncbi:MAG: biotin--[acetyl-CoA-carboxylase] ligase [Chloroflexi bacterium]|nr:biotin--[acetyl-CoA-carboxylase] ligase [Ardenticatenaceae bacterium]MBL1131024.1 biotin--[acetyl-CoA-carboxylase] ligase [Chloroflexota bacterium]NOG37122.1 biotin--[acetyl-CoA-carboxylase] ligase [Chloroflexota bacterium]